MEVCGVTREHENRLDVYYDAGGIYARMYREFAEGVRNIGMEVIADKSKNQIYDYNALADYVEKNVIDLGELYSLLIDISDVKFATIMANVGYIFSTAARNEGALTGYALEVSGRNPLYDYFLDVTYGERDAQHWPNAPFRLIQIRGVIEYLFIRILPNAVEHNFDVMDYVLDEVSRARDICFWYAEDHAPGTSSDAVKSEDSFLEEWRSQVVSGLQQNNEVSNSFLCRAGSPVGYEVYDSSATLRGDYEVLRRFSNELYELYRDLEPYIFKTNHNIFPFLRKHRGHFTQNFEEKMKEIAFGVMSFHADIHDIASLAEKYAKQLAELEGVDYNNDNALNNGINLTLDDGESVNINSNDNEPVSNSNVNDNVSVSNDNSNNGESTSSYNSNNGESTSNNRASILGGFASFVNNFLSQAREELNNRVNANDSNDSESSYDSNQSNITVDDNNQSSHENNDGERKSISSGHVNTEFYYNYLREKQAKNGFGSNIPIENKVETNDSTEIRNEKPYSDGLTTSNDWIYDKAKATWHYIGKEPYKYSKYFYNHDTGNWEYASSQINKDDIEIV